MPKAKTITKILLYILGSFVLALVIAFLLDIPSGKIIAQWKQPAGITYDGRGPYYISVVEGDVDWHTIPFERNHFIYLGRDAGSPSYGCMIKYSFHPGNQDLGTFLGNAKVQWTAKGVILQLPSGPHLFVPKTMFIGGR